MQVSDERANRENRPSPDALLQQAAKESRGRLKIFLGAAPGVGKTFEMLSTAQAKRQQGLDLVVGVVETHGRKETAALLELTLGGIRLRFGDERAIAWCGGPDDSIGQGAVPLEAIRARLNIDDVDIVSSIPDRPLADLATGLAFEPFAIVTP